MKKALVLATLAGVLAGSLAGGVSLVSINGKDVSDKDLAEYFAPMLGGQPFDALNAEQKRQLAQEYVMQQLIIADAKKQKLESDPLYDKELDNAKNAILLNVYQKKIMDGIKVEPARVRDFYNQNKDKYVRPARVQARHILVSDEITAKNIIKQLSGFKGKELVKQFGDFAAKNSIDKGSAANGGELGWFDESTMVKPFTDAAFSLKKGELSKVPVKTNFGYHIILKEDSQAKGQISFDEAKAGIENGLKFEEFKKIMAQKGQELLGAAKVEFK